MNELTPDEHNIIVDAIHDSATVIHKGQRMNERIKLLVEQDGFQCIKDKALRLALVALQRFIKYDYNENPFDGKDVEGAEAITAIKEALAQPEGCQCPECQIKPHTSDCAVHNEPAYPKGRCDCGAQPEQEPVAWMFQHNETGRMSYVSNDGLHNPTMFVEMNPRYALACPLYTTPPQRTWVGLTEDEISLIVAECSLVSPSDHYFAQAIETKLKEKNT